MGYLSYRVDIRDVAVRISERFQEYRSRIIFDRAFYLRKVVSVDKSGFDAVLWKRMFKKIERPAIYRFLRDYMSSVCRERLDGICYRCRS